MGNRELFSIDEFYHLYNRGVDKRIIFLNENDYFRFIRLLYVCNGSIPVEFRKIKSKKYTDIDVGEKLVAIGAYCLMPNHFHLLIREIHEGGAVQFMRKLMTAYSSYFNKKYERSGALFGSRFKSEHLDNDNYLKYIYSYIHLNPAKLKDPFWRSKNDFDNSIMNFVENYPYSSYSTFLTLKGNFPTLSPEYFPAYFQNPSEYREEIKEWLNYSLPRTDLGKTVDNSVGES